MLTSPADVDNILYTSPMAHPTNKIVWKIVHDLQTLDQKYNELKARVDAGPYMAAAAARKTRNNRKTRRSRK